MTKINKSPENDNEIESALNSIPEVQEEDYSNINYDLIASGPLYYDPTLIKPGYVPAFVADRPGEIETYKRYGYQIVLDEFNVGDNVASRTSKYGSAVTVQSKCGTLLVLMAIKEELHKKLMAHRDSKNKERDRALGKIEGIPEHLQTLNGVPLGEYTTRRK